MFGTLMEEPELEPNLEGLVEKVKKSIFKSFGFKSPESIFLEQKPLG